MANPHDQDLTDTILEIVSRYRSTLSDQEIEALSTACEQLKRIDRSRHRAEYLELLTQLARWLLDSLGGDGGTCF
mgnify:CR=1 FL=1